MSSVPIQNPVPEMTGRQLGFLIGTALGMIFLLYVIRYACYIVVIDVCILGDVTALKKLCCCWRNNDDDDEAGQGPPRQWRVRDVADLRTIGAFSNPAGFLYSNVVSEEKRQAFLELIIDSELLDCEKDSEKDPSLTAKDDIIGHEDQDQEKDSSSQNENDEHVSAMEEGSSSVISEIDNNACSICLLSLDEEGEVCSLRKCSHSFHRDCIKNWIGRSLNCPVCRKQMIDNDKLLDYISSNKKLFYMDDTNTNQSSSTSIEMER